MPEFTDQTGRSVFLPSVPKRIISLVPSQTELLAYLGLEKEVAGITKFCVHPPGWLNSKKITGGTKNINIESVDQLKPDLIIANKEENTKRQIEEFEKKYPVWISDVSDLPGAFDMIQKIGQITGKEKKSLSLIQKIKREFFTLPVQEMIVPACYLIWKNPYMTVGNDTFIHSMMKTAGFYNTFSGNKRYPQTSISVIKESGCKLLLLSSEPYPFKQKHIEELKKILPGMKILLVDGEMFSWYGSRLLYAPAYFKSLQKKVK